MSEHALRLKAPDPAKAHGAWVYLAISILAGVLAAARFDMLTALLAGAAFLGVFVLSSAFAVYPRRWLPRFAIGLAILLASFAVGFALSLEPLSLAYGAVAVFPAAAAAWLGFRHGFQSAGALSFAFVTLVVAAPASMCAGGAPHQLGLLLLALLAPFFAWRTWRTREALRESSGWTRARLRALGWREALVALLWTTFSVALVHILAR
ncbi:MAG: hypothetical protein ACKO4Q_18040 [Planctomycetota bacterium]